MSPARLRATALIAHGLLMLGLPFTGRLGLWLAFPLVAPLPGLWRARVYTFAWASLLVVFYAGGLLAEGYAEPARRAGFFLLALVAAVEFVALVLFVKITAVLRRAATAGQSPGSGGA